MSAQIDAAVIREQGVDFAVVVVEPHVLTSAGERGAAVRSFQLALGHRLIVLMSQDQRGIPTYWGRTDIVDFLRNVPLGSMPWKRYRSAA